MIDKESMHDWMLIEISLNWEAASVSVVFENQMSLVRTVTATEVVELYVPRKNEWGPSRCVNAIAFDSRPSQQYHSLSIEMQSGDVIRLVAKDINIPTD